MKLGGLFRITTAPVLDSFSKSAQNPKENMSFAECRNVLESIPEGKGSAVMMRKFLTVSDGWGWTGVAGSDEQENLQV